MKWGEIYRTSGRIPERGHKPGFYVIVSRDFIADSDDISTVVCAPVYGEVLGLKTEVVIGPDDGVRRQSAIRCDFLTLMFKKKLTAFVATLPTQKQNELRVALITALQLEG
ncbi:MAG: MazF family transcriptional regulator [Blastocatellia bacterium]|nr:MAG: MazF family transcriptional regulator [Blastocatellia bacterium]